LQVGAPLPVDVFDTENRLLLRRGNIIATDHQLERLIAEGLFPTSLCLRGRALRTTPRLAVPPAAAPRTRSSPARS